METEGSSSEDQKDNNENKDDGYFEFVASNFSEIGYLYMYQRVPSHFVSNERFLFFFV
jgi:hypothetical protein